MHVCVSKGCVFNTYTIIKIPVLHRKCHGRCSPNYTTYKLENVHLTQEIKMLFHGRTKANLSRAKLNLSKQQWKNQV